MAHDPEQQRPETASGEPADFEAVAAAFERARTLPDADRDRYLGGLGEEHPAVHREVVRLLAHHADDAGVLADPAAVLPWTLLEAGRDGALDEPEPPLPDRFGPYRPLRVLGTGGMGTVYLAERTGHDFEQRVAIKVLRAEAADRDLLQRFRTERRILASLTHPNIAALLDGGTTDDGRPFVVMEFVDGEDLVSYCASRRLPLDDRLDLFCAVCAAVDHAHHSLVVHRDLKPGNILVTADGAPKLLDFGIAKLLDHDATDRSIAVTRTGMRLLTPEYASPEQVRGEPVTVATDVYALGAILYELITGRRAQPLTARGVLELERVVCGQDPPSPSTAAPEMRRRLQGDLDTIVVKALQKDPRRRYSTAAALADDISRHRRGLPITARPDTWSYRATKFLRRHRFVVGSVVALFALLLAFVVVTAMQAVRIAEERDAARRQSELSTRTADFLVELFALDQPDEARADLVRARDLLAKGRLLIPSALEGEPEVRAGLMLAIGRSYTALGLYREAEEMLPEACAELEAVAPGSAAHAESLVHLAVLRRLQLRLDESDELLRRARERYDTLDPGPSAAKAAVAAAMAELCFEQGDSERAVAEAERALGLVRTLHEGPHAAVADALRRRANMRVDAGDVDGALADIEAVRAMRRGLVGDDHPSHAPDLRIHGEILKVAGRYDEAAQCLRDALALDRRAFGDDHPDVDTDIFALALMCEDAGRLDEAVTLFEEALRRDVRRFGEEHAHTALSKGQLAGAHSRRGDFELAEPLMLEALATQRRVLPAEHPEIATAMSNLGVLYHRWHKPEEAEPFFRDALEMRLRLFDDPDHPAILTSRNLMALVQYNRGDLAGAEEQYREVLAARRRKLGRHPHVAGSLYSVAAVVRARGNDAAALELLEESVAMYLDTLPPDHVDLARPLLLIGRIHGDADRFAEAEPYLAESYRLRAAVLEPVHPDRAGSAMHWGRCLMELGRLAEARERLEEARAGYEASLGADHRSSARCRELLAELDRR